MTADYHSFPSKLGHWAHKSCVVMTQSFILQSLQSGPKSRRGQVCRVQRNPKRLGCAPLLGATSRWVGRTTSYLRAGSLAQFNLYLQCHIIQAVKIVKLNSTRHVPFSIFVPLTSKITRDLSM